MGLGEAAMKVSPCRGTGREQGKSLDGELWGSYQYFQVSEGRLFHTELKEVVLQLKSRFGPWTVISFEVQCDSS